MSLSLVGLFVVKGEGEFILNCEGCARHGLCIWISGMSSNDLEHYFTDIRISQENLSDLNSNVWGSLSLPERPKNYNRQTQFDILQGTLT